MGKQAHEAFVAIYEDHRRKGSESVSGPGSTLRATGLVRDALPSVLHRLGVRSLLDAACGDGRWIAEIADELDAYLGLDIVPELIEKNRNESSRRFRVSNIIDDALPAMNAVLCRDCLVQLPLDAASRALGNFVRCGTRFVIATTFPRVEENRPSGYGGWRPLNLTLPPFNLPPPIELIAERAPNPDDKYNDKSLGVWEADAIRAHVPNLPPPGPGRLFIHIPKTTGTAFRVAAERVWGRSRVAGDYGEDDATHPAVRAHVYRELDLGELRRILGACDVQLLAGHFHYARYRHLYEPGRVVTFLREPIARLVSEYHHHRRHKGLQEGLLAFAEVRGRRNLQKKMLRGTPLDELGFFGLSERYRDSLMLLERHLGLDLEHLELNINPRQSALAGAYALPAEEEAQLRAWNEEDLAFYEEAQTLFEERLRS